MGWPRKWEVVGRRWVLSPVLRAQAVREVGLAMAELELAWRRLIALARVDLRVGLWIDAPWEVYR